MLTNANKYKLKQNQTLDHYKIQLQLRIKYLNAV